MTAVTIEHLTKSYGTARVLEDVSLSVAPGTIHAVLGANGSGKSTLVKVLGGLERFERGRVEIFGADVTGLGPAGTRRAGLRIVHQHAPLIASQTITEATVLAMGFPTGRLGRVRWRTAAQRARELCAAFHIDATPSTLVGQLSATARGLLALAFALHDVGDDRVALILDEATASLPQQAADGYLTEVRRLADAGAAVIMVTHRMGEVLAAADEVSVLADGRFTARGPVSDFDEHRLAAAITAGAPAETVDEGAVGGRGAALRRVWSAAGRDAVEPAPEGAALRVEGLTGATVRDLSFAVAPGEVVGVVGLAANGREELPRLLGHVDERRAGRVWVGGTELPARADPRAAGAAGLALLPADRLTEGGAASLRIDENLLLPDLDRYWHRRDRVRATVEAALKEFQVHGGGGADPFGVLSGGNQQKVILAKWLLTAPRVFVLDDPTQGVDPGSRTMIFEMLEAAALAGIAIVLFSSEPAQIAQLCGRVLVLGAEGNEELTGDAVTPATVTRLAAA